jgi:hypothetical protein
MQAEFASEQEEFARSIRQKESARERLRQDREEMGRKRKSDDYMGTAANGHKEP